MSKHCLFVLLLLGLGWGNANAAPLPVPPQVQTDSSEAADSTRQRKVRLLALPVVFFTPETRWAFGAGAQLTWRFRGEPESSKPSSVRPGFVYTQNRQILFYVPWRLYYKNEDWLSTGEIGYYRFNFFFFGLGNYEDTQYQEIFDVTFPRLRFNVYKRITPKLYLGGNYAFDGFDITNVEDGGLLATQPITGNEGGIISSLGVNGIWESRDNIFFPTEGEYGEAWLIYNSPAFLSDFSFLRFTFDLSKYYETPWEHVLAFNFYTDNIFGDAPFNQMAFVGGARRLRGYYEGRYRDNHSLVTQMEYRAPLFWRITATAHIGAGWVANSISEYALSDTRASYGGGLRFMLDRKEKINLRADYGRTPIGGNFYLTVSEAF